MLGNSSSSSFGFQVGMPMGPYRNFKKKNLACCSIHVKAQPSLNAPIDLPVVSLALGHVFL